MLAGSGIKTHVLGCKVNFADVAAVVGRLPGPGDLPVMLVGTCCVTAAGEKQSRQAVRRAARAVGSGGTVFVTGCAARRDPVTFAGLAENVVLLGGDADESARMISGLLGMSPAGGRAEALNSTEELSSATPASGPGAKSGASAARSVAGAGKNLVGAERTRFFLKVQDGCASGCSYCVIPQVRGLPRSVPLARLKQEARDAVAAGFPELVVTGINAGEWCDGEARLPELLAGLAATGGLRRLRLSSLEIGNLSGDLIEVMRRHEMIGRHLHLPLQSGDDGVLGAMGRRYNTGEYKRRLDSLREVLPDINVTTDVITGFPTEDGAAFDNTLLFVEEAGFTRLHVFSYSPRPGVRARRLGDPVPAAEKKRRSAVLRRLSDRLQKAHRQRKVGQISEILLESAGAEGCTRGYSSDYTRFVVGGGLKGRMARVLGEAVSDEGVRGKVVDYE